MPEFKNREEFEEWFRKLNLGTESMRLEELIEKAKKGKDPFWNPALRKKAKKESKPEKEFKSYNWITHKKKMAGQRAKIKELKAIENPSEKEKYGLKRLQNLLSWHNWALAQHEAGKSDKTIHNETQKRKEARSDK